MTVSTTLRLGLAQWSAGTDPYRRTFIHDSLGNLETKGFGFVQGNTLPSVGPEFAGFFFFHTVDERLYYCDGTNPWWVIIGAEGPFENPVALSFADTVGGDGVSNDASRATHVHPMPGFGSPVGVGTSATAGSGEPLARADHVHNLNDGSVDVSTIFQAGAITSPKIADSAVTSGKLAATSVDSNALGGGVVTSDKILNNSVSTAKIGTAAVTGTAVGTIDASKVTTGTFASARIPNLNANKITTGTINTARLPNSFAVQPGVIAIHPSNTEPAVGEWLPCDGQQVTDSSHPSLHAVLAAAGYPYGGTGASANIPDLRDVFPLGVAASGTGSTLGEGGGSLAHVHSGPSHHHAVNPGSTGTGSSGSHSHDIPNTGSAGGHSHDLPNAGNASPGGVVESGNAGLISGNDVSHAHTFSDTASSGGTHDHGTGLNAGSHSSHTVSGTSSTKASANAVQHYHTLSSTGSQSNHTHSITTSGSSGSHTHSLNLPTTDSTNAGTGNTGTQNPPYVVVAFWIKT